MSHQPERKEKNCLNCGTTVIGHYCHVCGQENVVTKESFWSLSKHFVYDILHFDGKFFHTLKYLLIRPGKVAREYCEGKRNSYLHPIRMYLFTSAVFFLTFFSLNNTSFVQWSASADTLTKVDRVSLIENYQARLKEDSNDTDVKKIIALLKDTTTKLTGTQILAMDPKPVLTINNNRYTTVKAYDSAQKALPSDKRDSWIQHMFTVKAIKFNEKYKGRTNEGLKIFWETFLHKLPYILFLSLPFFALILKLLYTRRKNFFYSDHAIFTLYHYIFSFILLLVMIGVSRLQSWTKVGDFDWVILLLLFGWMGYLLIEMKNFYRQGWLKTVGKFLLLDILGAIIIIILFFGFLVFSIFEL